MRQQVQQVELILVHMKLLSIDVGSDGGDENAEPLVDRYVVAKDDLLALKSHLGKIARRLANYQIAHPPAWAVAKARRAKSREWVS
jgi:hypothetical protein